MAEYKTVDKGTFTEVGKWVKGKGFVTTESLSGYATTAQLDGKVDKVEGSSLATEAQLAQIETNKTDIAGLKTSKVDKVEGSSLATSAQLTQIETNKTAIATINSDLSELATFLSTYA